MLVGISLLQIFFLTHIMHTRNVRNWRYAYVSACNYDADWSFKSIVWFKVVIY